MKHSVLVLAVLGVALGAAGLFMGISARKAQQELTGKIEALSALEQKIGAAEEQAVQAKNSVQTLAGKTQQVFNLVDQELANLKRQIKSITQPPPPAPAASVPDASATAGAASASSPKAGYAIQEGDNYDRIARRLGTTAAALIEANPGVNPLRLKVGQKIALPPGISPK